MSFLKKIFGKKEEVIIGSYQDFWNWFMQHEKSFFERIKNNNVVSEKFIDPVIENLQKLNQQFYCLAGMYNENTAELVISAEGDIKTFVFVEELVAAAPAHEQWKFTALKPAIGINEMRIEMNGFQFDDTKISFFNNEQEGYPDEIDLTLVHEDYNEENKNAIENGILIYLDNALGELNTATLIDNVDFCSKEEAGAELIPLKKLPEFLMWREKEFIEKYKGIRYNTDEDKYSALEAEDKDGLPIIAVVNQELLDWDAKPSHPWMVVVTFEYNDGNNGMPDQETYELMNKFEDELISRLPDSEGNLNLGRQTYKSERKIYLACKEFRHSSKTIVELIHSYRDRLSVSYTIYRDKYWMTMNRFSNSKDI